MHIIPTASIPCPSGSMPKVPLSIEPPYTDQKILHAYFRSLEHDVHPVATTGFLNISKKQYPPEWLARELVQNFVDHNPLSPGTLNGVIIAREELKNLTRFSMQGSWPFSSPTALISPHSDKPGDIKTAGGNGIGLKQVAILLMRDYKVDRFVIEGDGWNTEYQIVRAADLNSRIDSSSGISLGNDWLVARLTKAEPRDHNTYIIETEHPALIKALSGLSELGVSDNNPHLQGLCLNALGGLKWLCPESGQNIAPKGKLFLNGQITMCGTKGESAEDYWQGPKGITLQLNNVDYDMSIDRPPLSVSDISRYMEKMIEAFSKDELRTELRKSESLWPLTEDKSSPQYYLEYHAAIYQIVSRLHYYNKYTEAEFQSDFPERKYVVMGNARPSEEKLKGLLAEGFVILPEYFSKLGIPQISKYLSSEEDLASRRPGNISYAQREAAERQGTAVYGAEIDGNLTPTLFASFFKKHLMPMLDELSIKGEPPSELSCLFKSDISRELLWNPLPKPRGKEQELLYNIRGLILACLSKDICTEVLTRQEQFFSTYTVGDDSANYDPILQTRVTSYPGKSGEFCLNMKFKADKAMEYITAISQAVDGIDTDSAQIESARTETARVSKLRSSAFENEDSFRLSRVLAGIGVGLTLIGIPVGWSLFRSEEESSSPDKKRTGNVPVPALVTKVERGLPEVSGSSMLKPEREIVVRPKSQLATLVMQNNTARIEANPDERDAIKAAPPFETDLVTDFKALPVLSEKQKDRLKLLVTYFEIASDVKVENSFFVFQGKGARGINMGSNKIGLHEELLETNFGESFGTLVHEVAHNYAMNHGLSFVKCEEALHRKIHETEQAVIRKLSAGVSISEQERYLVAPQSRW